jgi:hypothetical protein
MKKEIVLVEANAFGHGICALAQAKKLGLSVDVLTCQPDFYRSGGDDPFVVVDRVEEVDTADPNSIVSTGDSGRAVGVLGLLQCHVQTTAVVAHELGLPHADIHRLCNCRYKDLIRQVLAHASEHRPHFAVLTEQDNLAASPVGYPCVVKPVDDSGSVGVQACQNDDGFCRLMALLCDRRMDVRNHGLTLRWLVEEYVEGPEFSAELLPHGGRWRVLGVTRKRVSTAPWGDPLVRSCWLPSCRCTGAFSQRSMYNRTHGVLSWCCTAFMTKL